MATSPDLCFPLKAGAKVQQINDICKYFGKKMKAYGEQIETFATIILQKNIHFG